MTNTVNNIIHQSKRGQGTENCLELWEITLVLVTCPGLCSPSDGHGTPALHYSASPWLPSNWSFWKSELNFFFLLQRQESWDKRISQQAKAAKSRNTRRKLKCSVFQLSQRISKSKVPSNWNVHSLNYFIWIPMPCSFEGRGWHYVGPLFN